MRGLLWIEGQDKRQVSHGFSDITEDKFLGLRDKTSDQFIKDQETGMGKGQG